MNAPPKQPTSVLNNLLVLGLVLPAVCQGVVLGSVIVFGVPFGPGLGDYEYDVAGGYTLYRTSSREVHVSPRGGWSERTPRIPPCVVGLAWDDRFVLAERQPLGERDGVPGSATDFWILDTPVSQAYGPLSKEDFGRKRAELGVPSSLHLQDPVSYRQP
jgi:hypothetical protein